MSYILEALRRAETERESRRRVPGLHAQPVPVLPGDEGPPRRNAWPWLVAGLAVALVLALLWRGSGQDAGGEEAARAAVAGSVEARPPTAVDPAASAIATPSTPATPPATPPAATAAETPPAAAHEPPPVHRKSSTAAKAAPKPHAQAAEKTRTPATAVAAAATAQPAPGTKTPPATPATAGTPEPPLRTLADLPADIRGRVPPLSFGGSVYSEVPAQRLVILNGQVLREGDAIADDVWLEQIRPHSAVIRVRGQRFEYPF